MLSGIGPAEELKRHDIPVVQDLPGVGDHLVDHPVVDAYFHNRNTTAKYVKPQGVLDLVKLGSSAARYLATGKGVLTTNVSASWKQHAAVPY
jgi:choline dehydrogenase